MSEKVNVASKDEHPHLTEARKHFAASRESMHQSMAELVPKGYLEHRRTARKEMLLAFRSLLDAAVERMDLPQK